MRTRSKSPKGTSTRGWKDALVISTGVENRLARRPAFLLIIDEVCRRHSRDLPTAMKDGQAFETRFERDDLPGGALQITTVCTSKRLHSNLFFAEGTR